MQTHSLTKSTYGMSCIKTSTHGISAREGKGLRATSEISVVGKLSRGANATWQHTASVEMKAAVPQACICFDEQLVWTRGGRPR